MEQYEHWKVELRQDPRRAEYDPACKRWIARSKVRALDLREHAGKLWLVCSITSARSELLLAHSSRNSSENTHTEYTQQIKKHRVNEFPVA